MMPQVLELLEHERAPANFSSLAAGDREGLARSTRAENIASRLHLVFSSWSRNSWSQS
jgi:hypothetical protein